MGRVHTEERVGRGHRMGQSRVGIFLSEEGSYFAATVRA